MEENFDQLRNIYAIECSQDSIGEVFALCGDSPESTSVFFNEVFPGTHLDRVYVMPMGWMH